MFTGVDMPTLFRHAKIQVFLFIIIFEMWAEASMPWNLMGASASLKCH